MARSTAASRPEGRARMETPDLLLRKARLMLRMERSRAKFRVVTFPGPKGRPKVLVKAVVKVAATGARVVMPNTTAKKANSPHRAGPRWPGWAEPPLPLTTTYFWAASTRL